LISPTSIKLCRFTLKSRWPVGIWWIVDRARTVRAQRAWKAEQQIFLPATFGDLTRLVQELPPFVIVDVPID
jgi:hypothetical protein